MAIVLKLKELPKFRCSDCGLDCLAIGDWYLASPKIWEETLGLDFGDNLCIACLERRLGRKLRPGILDIGPASTFYQSQPPLSARLVELWRPPGSRRRRRTRSATTGNVTTIYDGPTGRAIGTITREKKR